MTMEHIGNNLLVAQTLASSIKSLLGPQHSLKCCTSDDETVTCSSTSKLLQFMDIQHPAGFIINDTCLGHYKKYRTNCKTLVCLAGFWSRSARYLLDQGVPLPVIVHLFDEALEECENVCQEICLPLLETLHATLNISQPTQENCLIISDDITIGNHTARLSSDEKNCTIQCPSMENSMKLSKHADDACWFFGCHATVGSSLQSAAFCSSNPADVNNATESKSIVSHRSSPRHSEECQERIKTTDDVSSRTENYSQASGLETGVNVLSGVKQTNNNIKKMREISDSTLLMDQRIDELKSVPSVETSSCDIKEFPNVGNNFILHSEVDQNQPRGEDNDELNECFSDAIFSPAGEILPEPSVAKKRNENLNQFQTAARESKYVDHCSIRKKYSEKREKKTDAFPGLNSSKVMNSGLASSINFGNSAKKEEEITNKTLSFLPESPEMNNKGILTPVKYSEVYKGSRHMVNALSGVGVFALSSSDVNFNTKVDHTGYDSLEKSACSKRTRRELNSESSMKTRCNLTQSGLKTNQAGRFSLFPKEDEKITSLKSENSMSRLGQVNERILYRNRELLLALGSRLSHGKAQEMELAVEVISSVLEATGQTSLHDFEIDVNVIHSQLVLGPTSSFSQIVNGLLIECGAAFHCVVGRIEPGTQLSAALINGDVTPEYRHPGLNQECRIHRNLCLDDFKSRLFNQEQDWYQSVIHILNCRGIGVLIVKGIAHQSVLDYCLSHGIVVLQRVSYSCLQLLSHATDTIIVSYLSDLRESDIGRPVTIETRAIGWTPSTMRRQTRIDSSDDSRGIDLTHYVVVRESRSASLRDLKSSMQTVLLCNPCGDLLCDMEERFWNAVYRLKNSLRHNRVLPGAGAIEIACVQRLVKLADDRERTEMSVRRPSNWLQQSMPLFRPSVFKEFAQGIKDFLIRVVLNSGELNNQQALLFVEGLINKKTSNESSVKPRKAESFASQVELNWNCFPEKLDNPRDRGESPTPSQEDFQDQTFSLISSLNRAYSPGVVDSTVWDDYSAKIEAWKRAVSVVKILLQCDCLIQTGIKEQ